MKFGICMVSVFLNLKKDLTYKNCNLHLFYVYFERKGRTNKKTLKSVHITSVVVELMLTSCGPIK